MSIGVGVGTGLGAATQVAAVPAIPNLLRSTNDLTAAVWLPTTTDVVIVSVSPPFGNDWELVSNAPSSALRQVSETAVVTGAAATQAIVITGAWVRYSVTGSYDGQDYTFSIYCRNLGGSTNLTLQIDRSGGLLRVSILDAGGSADYAASAPQLEQASTATDYVAVN